MQKKTTGVIAGVAGAALLMGGTTFALWSDSADAPGGQITAGNLDVALVGDPAWQDVSADRTDNPHPIDLSTFRIVPGDTIEGSYAVDLALEGDNMVANLALVGGGVSGDLAAGLIDVSYTVEDATGAVVATGDSTGVDLDLASADNSNNVAALATAPAALDNAADYTVVVSVTFDAATSAQDLATTTANLAAASIQLNQTRDAGTGGGF